MCKGPYNHPTDFILITYISELFQTFDKYNSVCTVCARAIQPSPRFHFNQYFYVCELFQTLISIILCDCVCKGPYNHPTDFILITYISELFQTFDKYNSVCTVCARAIQPSPRFHFNQYFYVCELFQTLIRIILCDCVCKGHTAIPQISF